MTPLTVASDLKDCTEVTSESQSLILLIPCLWKVEIVNGTNRFPHVCDI